MQHAPIHDASRERAHQVGVRDTRKVIREVGVHDFPVAAEQRLFHLNHRLLGIAALAIRVLLGLIELGWPQGSSHAPNERTSFEMFVTWKFSNIWPPFTSVTAETATGMEPVD